MQLRRIFHLILHILILRGEIMKNKNSDTQSSRLVEITENKNTKDSKNTKNTNNTSSKNSTTDCGKNCGR